MGLNSSGKTVNAGAIAFFPHDTIPAGWLLADGSAISRTTYAALFKYIGTLYGAGDTTTTFNIPDLRGEFLRCSDRGKGTDAGRQTGTGQLDSLQNFTGEVNLGGGIGSTRAGGTSGVFAPGGALTYIPTPQVGASNSISIDASRVARTSTETRGRNIALSAYIKF